MLEAYKESREAQKGWPCPGWRPEPKKRTKHGNGLKRRYFDAKPDGSHGESKRGWGPDVVVRASSKTVWRE